MVRKSTLTRRLRLESLERRDTPTNLPTGFREVPITTAATLTAPTAMEIAPDGQLWVLEQGGNVKLIRADGTAHTALTLTVDSQGERGLLGIAFDPAYDGAGPNTDFVYLYYTTPRTSPSNPSHNRISHFAVTGAGTTTPTFGSESIVRELPPEDEDNNLATDGDTNHNGGAIHFGPDGKLYAAVGDHNYDNTPLSQHVSQVLTTPFGKMLRLNPDGTNPSDNPFFTGSATDWPGAIWARGLRNPFTFSINPANGQVFINDVGENSWEEIDKGEAGVNYGWSGSTAPLHEGFQSSPPWTNYRDPVMAYDHSNSPPTPAGVAITGGAFYPANNSFGAEYAGKYFFADFGANFIRVFDPNNPGSLATPDTSTDFASAVTGGAPVDLKIDSAGRLYFLARNSGKVFRIEVDTPVITQQPVNTTVTVGQPASFTVVARGATPLQYQWQKFDGTNWNAITGATSPTFTINATTLGDAGDYRVVVTNSRGFANSNTATLVVNQLPTGTIDAPGKFTFNQTINFTGTGTDPEDGTLPASAFRWRVDYHHDGQVELFVPEFTGSLGGSFIANGTSTDPNQFYRIVLTLTDSNGGSTTVTRDVTADTVALSFASQPAGVALTIDGQSVTGPVSGVIGQQRTIAAPLTATIGDFAYRFVSWSDGGAATHMITTPLAPTDYVTTYARVTPGLTAEFFDFSTPLNQIPDLTGLTADPIRTDAMVSYAATTLPWAGLGANFADTFAARHTGFVRVDKTGKYTFYLRSGDGSKLWVDDQLVIDNDGIHAMRERFATRTLSAGYHSIRVESFENTGGAGLVLLWAGPGIMKSVIPAVRLFHDAPAGALAFRQSSAADGLVVMEAENNDGSVLRNGRWWRDTAVPIGFSGVGAMRVPGTGVAFGTNFVSRSPRLDFRVDFLQTGTHYLWVRGRGPTTGDDSLHVGLDGAAVTSADRIVGLKPAFGWTNATADHVIATIDVSTPGIHTVNVWMWEDGAVLDKLLLTTSSSFVPSGVGQAESPHTEAILDFTGGFAGANGLQLNGSAAVAGSSARLTNSGTNEAGSVFSFGHVHESNFVTTFDFRLTSAIADGFAFVIQGVGNSALGSTGEGLGYQGIGTSMAIKFDIFDNAGEGGNSTGLYINGQPLTTGGTDLTPSGIDLHSGHDFRVSMAYTGGTLGVSIRDLVSEATALQTYTIDIPTLVGGNSAYVGFTGGSSGLTATQDVLNWGFWN